MNSYILFILVLVLLFVLSALYFILLANNTSVVAKSSFKYANNLYSNNEEMLNKLRNDNMFAIAYSVFGARKH